MGFTVRIFDIVPTNLKLCGISRPTQINTSYLRSSRPQVRRPQSGTKNKSTPAGLLFRLNRLERNHVLLIHVRA
jgi:hypothetical protein